MAGPTPDSQNADPLAGSVPGAGPRSQTPSALGAPPTPIGVPPMPGMPGVPGAPTKTPVVEIKPEDKDAFKTLIEDIYNSLVDDKIQTETVGDVKKYLTMAEWPTKRLSDLANYLDTGISGLVKNIALKLNKIDDDDSNAINITYDNLLEEIADTTEKKEEKKQEKEERKQKEKDLKNKDKSIPSAPAAPPAPPAAPAMPPGLPPVVASLGGIDGKLSDVYSSKNIFKRGINMSKKTFVLTKEGEIAEKVVGIPELIKELSFATRKAKVLIKECEDLKLKYAGHLAIKYAEEGMPPMGGGDAGPDMGMEAPMGDMGMEAPGDGGTDSIVEEVKEEVSDLTTKIDDLIEKVDEVLGGTKNISEDEELEAESSDLKDFDEGIGAAKKSKGDLVEASKVLALIKEGKWTPPWAKDKEEDGKNKNPFSKKKKDEKNTDTDESDASKKKKDDKDDKKDDKKDKKDDKKDDKKKASMDVEELIVQVRAKLDTIRTSKEAQSDYPFKEQIKPIPPVSNINQETAKQTISKVDSEITKDPVKDKKDETLNMDGLTEDGTPGSDPLGKSAKGQKKVSVEAAERVRQSSIEGVTDKARLAVELAARQQMKGLIDDPLKIALVKNMEEIGVSADIAAAVIHNAYIDGYEASHTAIIKEAFDTFMDKDYDEFVKIAEFTKDFIVREASIAPVKVEEDIIEKTASSLPLRSGRTDGSTSEKFKGYWQDVARRRSE